MTSVIDLSKVPTNAADLAAFNSLCALELINTMRDRVASPSDLRAEILVEDLLEGEYAYATKLQLALLLSLEFALSTTEIEDALFYDSPDCQAKFDHAIRTMVPSWKPYAWNPEECPPPDPLDLDHGTLAERHERGDAALAVLLPQETISALAAEGIQAICFQTPSRKRPLLHFHFTRGERTARIRCSPVERRTHLTLRPNSALEGESAVSMAFLAADIATAINYVRKT